MIKFNNIELHNFGPYKGKQKVDFTDKNGVTIIWGENGNGKTMFSNALRFALYGYSSDRYGEKIPLKDLLNIDASIEEDYSFGVTLNMFIDGEEFSLYREFEKRDAVEVPENDSDFVEKIYMTNNEGTLSANERENKIKSAIPEDISKFFFFDGERLNEYEDLLQKNNVGRKLRESIEDILGVPILKNAKIDINELKEEKNREADGLAKKDKALQKLNSQLSTLKEGQEETVKQLEETKKELANDQNNKKEVEESLKKNESLRELFSEKKRKEDKIREYEEEEEKCCKEILDLTDSLWMEVLNSGTQKILSDIDIKINELNTKQNEKRKNNELIKILEESLNNSQCTACEQQINDMYKGYIAEKIKKIKVESINDQCSVNNDELENLKRRRDVLTKIKSKGKIDRLNFFEGQLKETRVKKQSESSNLKQLNKEIERYGNINTLGQDLDIKLKEQNNLVRKIYEEENSIKKLEDKWEKNRIEIESLRKKIEKNSSDVSYKKIRKQVELCENICNLFDKSIEGYCQKIKIDVEKDATKLFTSISNNKEYEKLQITDNYGLNIIHKNGQTVPMRSSGYEHIVALCLIDALHKNAPLKGPLVMDAPFERLDKTHRENVVSTLTKMSDQVILLVHDGQLDEQKTRNILNGDLINEYEIKQNTAFQSVIEPK